MNIKLRFSSGAIREVKNITRIHLNEYITLCDEVGTIASWERALVVEATVEEVRAKQGERRGK